MTLAFIVAGVIGLVVTVLATRSDGFRSLSARYTQSATPEPSALLVRIG